MMYKATLSLHELAPECEDVESLPVPELLGKIPKEWEQEWWTKKLKHEPRAEILDMFRVAIWQGEHWTRVAGV